RNRSILSRLGLICDPLTNFRFACSTIRAATAWSGFSSGLENLGQACYTEQIAPRSISRRDVLRLGAACLFPAGLARSATTLVRRPYLQNVQGDRASILWTTLAPRQGRVNLVSPDGVTSSTRTIVRSFPAVLTKLPYDFYQYQADITGLTPGTEY